MMYNEKKDRGGLVPPLFLRYRRSAVSYNENVPRESESGRFTLQKMKNEGIYYDKNKRYLLQPDMEAGASDSDTESA